MKKSIMIFGGSMFINETIKANEYKTYNNKIVVKLKEKFNIDNFSNRNLTIKKSLNFLNIFIKERVYSDCILALGEADMDKTSLLDFKNSLLDMVHVLKENKIRPLLVSLPKKYKNDDIAFKYQMILDEIAQEEELEYIYNGETNQEVSYMVNNDSQMKKALMDLCK